MTEFRVEHEPIEVTRDGSFGGPVDQVRRFVPGPPRYFVDEVEVDLEVFEARFAAELLRPTPPS